MKKRMILGLLGLAFIVGLGVADDLVPVAVSPGAENGPAMARQSCPTFSWYVGAMVNAAQGSWSEGRKFIIAESPAWGVVSEPRVDGIGGSGSRQVSRDPDAEPAAKAQEKFNLADDPLSQQMIDVEGTEGSSNTFYGLNAGNATMSGGSNSFFGRYAGTSNTSGYSNTFMGRAAGRLNKQGYENTFLGIQAGYANTSGHRNVSVGSSAGFHNTTGNENVFVGYSAGWANTYGGANSFFGHMAGASNTSASYNTFIGWYAGYSNETGIENTFLGDDAGYLNNGSGNVFLGNEAGYSEPYSDRLYINNSSANSPLIYGEFDNKILNFNAKLRINPTTSSTITVPTHLLDVGTSGAYCNGAAWVDGSSRDFKENVEELTTAEAQQAFEKLEPVKFNYKENSDETYLGFIAEDVPDLVAMNDRKGLNPMDMVAMLTKVVQEQQKSITELQKKITKLEKRSRKEK